MGFRCASVAHTAAAAERENRGSSFRFFRRPKSTGSIATNHPTQPTRRASPKRGFSLSLFAALLWHGGLGDCRRGHAAAQPY